MYDRPVADLFSNLKPQAPDPLLSLIALYSNDPRPEKIDLGVGVYRNEEGHTPVMRAMKSAERRLVEEQPTKSCLGPEGDAGYAVLCVRLALGDQADGVIGVQTPGGTGALRLAAALIQRPPAPAEPSGWARPAGPSTPRCSRARA